MGHRLLLVLLVGVVPQQVPEHGGGLVEAARAVLGRAVGAQQVGVGRPRGVQGGAVGAELGGGGAQQRLGLLDVVGDELLGQFGVRPALGGGVPFGFAAQSAEVLARGGRAGFQHLYEGLGAGGGGLPGGSVGAVGAFQELGGAGADLVGEAVELGEGGALVALGAGLFGAQVGADADLLVEPGGGAVGLAEVGERGLGRAVVGGQRVRCARDLGAFAAQGAGGAAGVVGGALGGAAVLVGGAGPVEEDLGAGLGLGGVLGEFAQPALPKPARSRSR